MRVGNDVVRVLIAGNLLRDLVQDPAGDRGSGSGDVLDGRASDLTFAFVPQQAPGLRVDSNHYVSGRVSGKSLDEWLGAGYERNATRGQSGRGADGRPRDGSSLPSPTIERQPFP